MDERLEESRKLLSHYYDTENTFEQSEIADEFVKRHANYLIIKTERVDKLELWAHGQKLANKLISAQVKEIEEENKRYKQVIDLIEKGYHGSGDDLDAILDKFFFGGTSPVRDDSNG